MSRFLPLVVLCALACNGKKAPVVDAEPVDVLVDADTELVVDAEPDTEMPPVAPTDASLALLGTRWKLTWIDGADAPSDEETPVRYVQVDPGTPPNLSGYAGCNRFYGAAFTATETAVSFGPMGSTRRACAQLDDEHAFMRALGEVDRWSVDGDSLSLSKADAERLRFVAIEIPADE